MERSTLCAKHYDENEAVDCPVQHTQSDSESQVTPSAGTDCEQPHLVTPGPAGVISFDAYVDPLRFLAQLWERYGDVLRYRTRFGHCFLFLHPEHAQTILHRESLHRTSLVKMLLGDGLLVSDGPRWKSQRRLMQREFLPRSVAPFVSVMARETARSAQSWQLTALAGDPVDVPVEMSRLTLRVIVKALFSEDLTDTRASELCTAVTQVIVEQGKLSWMLFGLPASFTPASNAIFAAAKAVLDAVAYDMINHRRGVPASTRPHDILTLLLEAETDTGSLSDLQIRDEIMTMLVGGHETTALSLAWAWKAIAENPDVEAALHAEIDQVLGGRCPELEDLSKLSYTRGIFQEALRLYPPVWYQARLASEDTVIHGHFVPRGACVLVSGWFTHRHKDFWPDPELFDPTRFSNSPAQATHRDAYFPFGDGRHICLGMHFALLEGTLILAQLSQQFRVRPIPGQQVLPHPGITLRQSPGLAATIELRSCAAKSRTLLDILLRHASSDPDRIAYTFLVDGATDARSITWSQLARRARARGELLCQQGAIGKPVLLALPSGLAFVEWIFACWYAGAIVVPVSLPRHLRVKHRLEAIIADAGVQFVIATVATRQRLEADRIDAQSTTSLAWIDADAAIDPIGESDSARPACGRIALLQYTSGSTGTPRGVIVTHDNLICNSALIAETCGIGPADTIAGWLPLFHDMGLIGLVLQATFSGARCVFMAPERFLMHPWLWLQMISDYGARCSPAPNFAYDLCVDKISEAHKATLNLSGWRCALNGSEPVRGATLERFAAAFAGCGFRRDAFIPCYGLAEATLLATAATERRWPAIRRVDGAAVTGGDGGGYVSCGRACGDTQLAIVDPATCVAVMPGTIGEIWLAGNIIADGYWNEPQASAVSFNAAILGTTQVDTGRKWLRSGDLGFIADGELFITGRLRELIIVAGRNYFPADIEGTVESADSALAAFGAVAFALELDGLERLIIAAELRREYRRPGVSGTAHELDPAAVRQRVRAAVVAAHEVTPYEVVLLRPGAVRRTSSGKISRTATREAYVGQTLEAWEHLDGTRSAI
jgi:acyl-CoA synthetase (AMP-forming)/AMP-acid ligase II/cytochrome P450